MIYDIGTIAIVIFAALAWGANEPWAMALISISAIALFSVKLISGLWRGNLGSFRFNIFLPLFLLLLFAGLQAVNLVSEPPSGEISLPYTIERHSTLLYLILAAGYVCIMLLTVSGFRSRKRLKLLLYAVLVLGIFEGIYGLVQYLGGYPYIWGYRVPGGIAQGTLINRNHYALLLNLCICCGVGVLYYRSASILKGRDLSLRRVLSTPGSAQLAWLLLWPVLMGVALVFSMSRMGIMALLCCMTSMVLMGKTSTGKRRVTVFGIALIGLVLTLVVYAGIDAVLARYEAITETGYIEKDRLPIWRDAWEMIDGHLILGRGLGTFQWSFPAYERLEPDVPAKYAHNDYLQALAEVGVVGLALLVWTFLVAWRIAVRNLRQSDDPLARGIGLALIGALTATALQEITDFSLYIPATALLLAVLMGMNVRAGTHD